MKFRAIFLPGAAIANPAQQNRTRRKDKPPAASSSAMLDRLVTAGKSPQELARYVFYTQGCRNCQTIGQGDKLGTRRRANKGWKASKDA